MNILRTGLAIIVMSAPTYATNADWDTLAPEAGFIFQGGPIHPNCPSAMEPRDGASVSLAGCTAGAKDYGPVKHINGEVSAEGIATGTSAAGYASYRVLAARKNQFILLANWNGGGSGHFDEISLYEINGDKLTRKTYLAGGDRCSGGLSDVHAKNGKIYYALSATPYDMIQEVTGNKDISYNDISSAPLSCAAAINIERDLNSGVTQRLSISLTGDSFENGDALEDSSAPLKYEHCFNTYYNSWYTRGRHILKGADIASFGQGFMKACLK